MGGTCHVLLGLGGARLCPPCLPGGPDSFAFLTPGYQHLRYLTHGRSVSADVGQRPITHTFMRDA